MNSEKILLLAALGLGAYFMAMKTQAKSGATTPAAPATPRPTGTQPQSTQNRNQAVFGMIKDGVDIVGKLFNTSTSNRGTQSDGNAGEAAARTYFDNNRDLFAVSPPPNYTYNDGSGYGFLDSQ